MATTATRADPDIRGLTCDSRKVEPGFLFAALKGSRADGAAFIDDALARGAVALLSSPEAVAGRAIPVPVVTDHNPRRRYALVAARFHGAQPATIAAVTGTNGKTSVVSFLRQIWTRLGAPAASLGTLGLESPGQHLAASLTTPDPVALHRQLADLAGRGVNHLAIEASSHGLDQHRLDGVRVTAAAFTNLTRDHLDYHHTLEAYFAAKCRLFGAVMAPGGVAVLNADLPQYPALADICRANRHRIISFGVGGGDVRPDLRLAAVAGTTAGQRLTIEHRGVRREVETGLIGEFQAANLLCAVGLALACGAEFEAVLDGLPRLAGVRGRVERVAGLENGAGIYVDYAHTPDALCALLGMLRSRVAGRLHVVFGCGGERDRGKRLQMGQVAAALADRVIITDDNPRGEDPAAIRAEILAGCPAAEDIGDRGQAIETAIAGLGPGDSLVVAGKGHETGQIVGGRTIPFDDAEIARAAAKRR